MKNKNAKKLLKKYIFKKFLIFFNFNPPAGGKISDNKSGLNDQTAKKLNFRFLQWFDIGNFPFIILLFVFIYKKIK